MAKFDVGKFSKHMKTTRTSSGLSMSAMAKSTGISKATISRIENRHYPDVVTFLVLCKWAGLKPEWYLERDMDNAAKVYSDEAEKRCIPLNSKSTMEILADYAIERRTKRD